MDNDTREPKRTTWQEIRVLLTGYDHPKELCPNLITVWRNHGAADEEDTEFKAHGCR